MPTLQENNLQRQVHFPQWQWARFAPVVSSALSSSCSADNPDFLQAEHGRFIYYLISATEFWRYDTWANTYQKLASPPVAPVSFTTLKFAGALGYEGNVLAAGAQTITVPAVFSASMRGFDVVIVSGTGAGQRRTITAVAEAVVHDSGIATAVSNTQGAISITDTLKAWIGNQYAGYSLRISGNSGVGQVRRILSNTATIATLGDVTQVNKPWNNPAIFSPAISATAGVQSAYSIESQVLTVDSAWGVQPDATSVFRIQSSLILMVSSAGAAPFYTLQAYDYLTDTWYILQANSNMLAAAASDMSLERTSENASIWARGAATGGSATTLVDGTRGVDVKAWKTNQWAGYWVHIFSGTGAGQIRQITGNTGTTLSWESAGTAPDATSRYMLIGFDAGTATAGGAASLTDSTKAWATNRWANYAVRILSGTGAGQVRAIASNTATALTVIGAWATNPDSTSVYAIQGDPGKAYLFLGGNSGVLINNFESSTPTFGREQDFGIARNAAATVAGHQPVAITSLSNSGTTATAGTAQPHQFRVGDLVTVRGATDANFNVTNVVIASVPSGSTFTYVMAGTPAATTIPGAQSTSTLVDLSKNWTVNQWAGFTCYMNVGAVAGASGAATGQVMRIISNTANSLTFAAAATAPINGVSRYSIAASGALGAADFGVATGTHSTTTLQDTTKSWPVNIWAGKRVRITTSAGFSAETIIASNTANTLTFGAIAAPTNLVTGYVILEQPVKGAGLSANWAFGPSNPAARGRFMYATRGGGANGFDRLDLATDRFSMMPTFPQTETLSTGSMTAYDGEDRIYFHKDATRRINYLDVVTGRVAALSQYPYVDPTAVLGNRMEIFTTKDGLKFLWLNRASFAEVYRCLLHV
jgi:hypothetical protein